MDLKLKLAYIAGIIDGEGNLGVTIAKPGLRNGIVRKTPSFRGRVKISMCDQEALALIYDLFGGSVSLRETKNLNWRPQFEWVLVGKKAKEMLQSVLPYLRIKRKQTELVIKLINRVSYGRKIAHKGTKNLLQTSSKEVAIRQKIVDEIHLLNATGTQSRKYMGSL